MNFAGLAVAPRGGGMTASGIEQGDVEVRVIEGWSA
jgi:hypothetical protein